MKNILVTGSTGFIGKRLLERLTSELKLNITCLVRKTSSEKTFHHPNIKYLYFSDNKECFSGLQNQSFDAVIHLATLFCRSHTVEDLAGIIDSNISFGTYLIEALGVQKNLVFINTDTYFYKNFQGEIIPQTLYAASKAAFIDLLKFYSLQNHYKTFNISLTDTYGPNDSRDKLVNLIIKSVKQKKELVIQNPDKEINLLHVDDVIDAFIYILKNHSLISSNTFSSFSIRNSKQETIRSLINEISLKKDTQYIQLGKKQEVIRLDNPLTSPLPGWSPKRPITSDQVIELIKI